MANDHLNISDDIVPDSEVMALRKGFPAIAAEKGFAAKAHQLLFLWLMKEGPAYGYELATRFEQLTKGHIRVSYGTVYPFLRRMERRGLIHSTKDEPSGRVYYLLTPKGKVAVKELSGRLKESQEYFDQKLLGFLAIYSRLFGRQALKQLLKQA